MARKRMLDSLWNTLGALRGAVRARFLKYLLALILMRCLELERAIGRFPSLDGPDLGAEINKVARSLGKTSSLLKDIFGQIDFTSEEDLGGTLVRNRWLREVLGVLGDAVGSRNQARGLFQEVLDRFLEHSDRNEASAHTPYSLRELMARIAAPQSGDRICDPFCGNGSLLVRVSREGRADSPIAGQDIDFEARTIGLMNLVVNNFSNIQLKRGDTLEEPLLADDGGLLLFDLIVSDPPLGHGRWGRGKIAGDHWGRFRWGVPPRNQWGWAVVSHIISTLDRRGRAVVTAPMGLLFRGGSEAGIRQNIIEENLVDGVVVLPRRVFRKTSGPIALIVFSKSKSDDSILFIDARRIADEGRAVGSRRDMDQIVSIWKRRRAQGELSNLASLDEIADADFSLDVARYLAPDSSNDEMDLSVTWKEIEAVDTELRETWAELAAASRKLSRS